MKPTFTFGRNWQSFLRNYSPGRQKIAQDSLLNFLQMENLQGKSFLDIGSGSGIHSAAAWLSGASRVHSFDYDPDSVAATRALHRHHGSPANWVVEQGSVLDAAYMQKLATFDIVYSWGVLHHTGDQWQALRNTLAAMHEKSRLYIALYAKEAYLDWPYWVDVKRRYNQAGWLRKRLMEMNYIWESHLGEKPHRLLLLPQIMWEYKRSRGMHLMTDVRDWLGGWPTEFSSVPEIAHFMEEPGLALVNLATGEGNSEYLFVRRDQAAALGYRPVDLYEQGLDLPWLDEAPLPQKPVWIFGAGHGGDLIWHYLADRKVPVAGFIDVEKTSQLLHGLPILHVDDFIRRQPQETPVILANRFARQNGARLRAAGFTNLFNAHRLVALLHKHGKNAPGLIAKLKAA